MSDKTTANPAAVPSAPVKETPPATKAAVKTAAPPKATPKPAAPAKASTVAAPKPATASKAAPPAPAPKTAKPGKAPKPAPKAVEKAPKPGKVEKVKKPKLVRDSFTMPEDEYALIAAAKKRLLAQGVAAKKSEVLRAALALFAAQNDAALAAAIGKLPVVKTGRPAK